MVLNAKINQSATLELDPQYSYVMTSKQNFTAHIEDNLLTVLSTADVGTYQLSLNATSKGT